MAHRIRELRRRKALSQRDLAKLAGVSPRTIAALEKPQPGAEPYPSTIRKVAEALGVPPERLTSGRRSP